MAQANEDYAALAAASRAAAAAEILENVRLKHLASAAAWDGLSHIRSATGEQVSILPVERLAMPAAGKGNRHGQ